MYWSLSYTLPGRAAGRMAVLIAGTASNPVGTAKVPRVTSKNITDFKFYTNFVIWSESAFYYEMVVDT